MLKLQCKEDAAEAGAMWEAFWQRENSRPLIVAKNAERLRPGLLDDAYYRSCRPELHDAWVRDVDEAMCNMDFWLECMPYVTSDLGPDQFAALMGSELQFNDASRETNWIEPTLTDIRALSTDWEQLAESPTAHCWLALNRKFHAMAEGKYLVGCNDLHSALDALSALRGAQQLCLDCADDPEGVESAMRRIRAVYQPLYLALEQAAGRNRQTGSVGWIPAWCSGRFAVTQCDFSCMISTADFRRYQLPALEEELEFLDRTVYHLDGIGALHHVDDLLALKQLDAIQWVPGPAPKRMWQWEELLLKFKAAGKLIYLYDLDDMEQAKHVHRMLGGYRGCFYHFNGNCSRADVEALAHYFETHGTAR